MRIGSNLITCFSCTLYTGPKPPCPSLLERWKLSVAAAALLKSNSNSSCSLTSDSSSITLWLSCSGVPPLLYSTKASLFTFLTELINCQNLAEETNTCKHKLSCLPTKP